MNFGKNQKCPDDEEHPDIRIVSVFV